MDNLYIVMPAYNEEENIEPAIKEWYPLLDNCGPESRLIIADSGSTDQTHSIITELQKEYPKLETLETNLPYHGPKLISLYKHAISENADFVLQTDSDRQCTPNEFMRFWRGRNAYDAILGNRNNRRDGWARIGIELVVCRLLKLYFNVTAPDANAPYRLMTTEILSRYIDRLPEDYAIPNIMLTAFFLYYNEKVKFVPVSFKPRKAGNNKINLKKIFKIGVHSLRDFQTFKKDCLNH